MRGQVLYRAAQVRLDTASQPCITAESFLDCSKAARSPSCLQVWLAGAKTGSAVGQLALGLYHPAATHLSQSPLAYGVISNLSCTQHHHGKEILREQYISAVAL